MVKVSVGPVQGIPLLVYVGVTTIVAISDDVPAIAAKLGILFSSPLSAKPIEVLSFIQL